MFWIVFAVGFVVAFVIGVVREQRKYRREMDKHSERWLELGKTITDAINQATEKILREHTPQAPLVVVRSENGRALIAASRLTVGWNWDGSATLYADDYPVRQYENEERAKEALDYMQKFIFQNAENAWDARE